jgi:hypothetical protein
VHISNRSAGSSRSTWRHDRQVLAGDVHGELAAVDDDHLHGIPVCRALGFQPRLQGVDAGVEPAAVGPFGGAGELAIGTTSPP